MVDLPQIAVVYWNRVEYNKNSIEMNYLPHDDDKKKRKIENKTIYPLRLPVTSGFSLSRMMMMETI